MSGGRRIVFTVLLIVAILSVFHVFSESIPEYMSIETHFMIFLSTYVMLSGYFLYVIKKYNGWEKKVSFVALFLCVSMAAFDIFFLNLLGSA